MSILAVGSFAYDDIMTPYASRDMALGGSAVYFALAAQHFGTVNLVAVVGEDLRPEDLALMENHRIDTSGLMHAAGKSFYWKGEYLPNWNDRITHATELNVFEHFNPVVPPKFARSDFVFLGNIHPTLQSHVLDQVIEPKLVALDTMNLWIERDRKGLVETLERVDLLFVNDSEARQLTGVHDLLDAARKISEMGPTYVCIKRGEYGAMLVHEGDVFLGHAFAKAQVVDPTGAGDAFAGGCLGYLSTVPAITFEAMKKALVYGGVMGSFTVESFSVDKLASATEDDVKRRYREILELSRFWEC